jgi:tRNA nucleotidyltransferase (CCA-adding enzyme)
MDFDIILTTIKPTINEKEKVESLADSMIDYINQNASEEGIPVEALLVGSVAKKTWLSGKADIDIFLHFPLDTPLEQLKEQGLFIGHKCIKHFSGTWEERYASHPYVTGFINGYSVDLVPCYAITSAKQLKSAVDRTILHTHYIKSNLKENQINEVLLLKKFMEGLETYGSEFKVGGFAGYLCELLILKYNNFMGVLNAAAYLWKNGIIIDLEDYKTGEMFDDSLVVVDPVDKNRNVASALKLQKMAEFIAASRNFLKSPSEDYFKNLTRCRDWSIIAEQFNSRSTKTYLICFKPPEIPSDAIYPQLKKTEISFNTKLDLEGFNIFKSGNWSDESNLAFIILEFGVWSLPDYKNHEGPRVWENSHQERFLDKYGHNAWIENDRWMVKIPQKYNNAKMMMEYLLSPENIHLLKVGKHLKDEILKENYIIDINEFLSVDGIKKSFPWVKDDYKKTDDVFLDLLEFLDDFLNPGKNLFR